jgi:dephospho-CoA kinase
MSQRQAPVPIIGISGGIASGKSEVARRLADLGAVVLNADQLGHEVLLEPEVKQALRERWGETVFHDDGTVNRGAVAARVFGSTAEHELDRRFLEHITHPQISLRLRQRLETLQAERVPAIVVDAALLFEAGWHQLCDHLLFVDAPSETRRQRAAERGWSLEPGLEAPTGGLCAG